MLFDDDDDDDDDNDNDDNDDNGYSMMMTYIATTAPAAE